MLEVACLAKIWEVCLQCSLIRKDRFSSIALENVNKAPLNLIGQKAPREHVPQVTHAWGNVAQNNVSSSLSVTHVLKLFFGARHYMYFISLNLLKYLFVHMRLVMPL